MKKVYLEYFYAQNYRNLSKISFELIDGINIITGANGSGKTNILESISLLSPGKGLKSAKFEDICRFGTDLWQTKFRLQSKLGLAEIETSFFSNKKSRKLNYNGSKLASSELSNLLNVIWLTPQMEGLFLGSSSERRRFLDRIVFNFDSMHVQRINKYNYYMRERSKSLSQGDYISSGSWLNIIEEKMAIEAEKIDKARNEVISYMQEIIDNLNTQFPKARLEVSKLADDQDKWENFCDNYMRLLANNRQKDFYSGKTSFGVHKSDLLVFHKSQNQLARFCSTGEQKALLISVVLSSIESVYQNTSATPILLLDELFVHLDKTRKKYLSDYITCSKLQTFITTTDTIGIEELASNAHIIEL